MLIVNSHQFFQRAGENTRVRTQPHTKTSSCRGTVSNNRFCCEKANKTLLFNAFSEVTPEDPSWYIIALRHTVLLFVRVSYDRKLGFYTSHALADLDTPAWNRIGSELRFSQMYVMD